MDIERVSVEDGKYTLINDSGKMTALRHGEPWNRDINGDKLIYAMFARIQQLEQDLKLAQAAPSPSPQDLASGPKGEAERLLQAIGDAAHRVGIYNGTAPLSGPLALMLLNDMVTQSGMAPREILSSAQEEARALGAELATAAQHDDNDPEGHDISAGLLGPNVSAWLRKVAAQRFQAQCHAESGKTADELWMETGRLRARLADTKASAGTRTATAGVVSSEPAPAPHHAPRALGAGPGFMRPMVSRASIAGQQAAHTHDSNGVKAADHAHLDPMPRTGMRKLKR